MRSWRRFRSRSATSIRSTPAASTMERRAGPRGCGALLSVEPRHRLMAILIYRALVGRRMALWLLLSPLLLSLLSGCGSENLQPAPIAGSSDVYWDLNLSHHAV